MPLNRAAENIKSQLLEISGTSSSILVCERTWFHLPRQMCRPSCQLFDAIEAFREAFCSGLQVSCCFKGKDLDCASALRSESSDASSFLSVVNDVLSRPVVKPSGPRGTHQPLDSRECELLLLVVMSCAACPLRTTIEVAPPNRGSPALLSVTSMRVEGETCRKRFMR